MNLKNCKELIPKYIKISTLNWKTICYNVINEGNLLIKGDSGSGKTKVVLSLKEVFPDRPFFLINLGSTQDPQTTLIGKTHYNNKEGTFFGSSYFIKACQTENAIIVLDELTRSHKEAWNIIMSALDPNQRYIRIDDEIDTPTIKIAKGVCFIATANIGKKFTATNILDFAVEERFDYFEMDILKKEEEYDLQVFTFPNIKTKIIKDIVDIAIMTRDKYFDKEHDLNQYITTKQVYKFLKKYQTGAFTFLECTKIQIFNRIKNDDDLNFIKQIFNKYEYK